MPNNYDMFLNCIICSINCQHILKKLQVSKLLFFISAPRDSSAASHLVGNANLNYAFQGVDHNPFGEKLSASFISGFFDAEGSFIISIFRRSKFKVG
jgi:hypothetical protein